MTESHRSNVGGNIDLAALIAASLLAVVSAGCAQDVRAIADQPKILVRGAPQGALLFVDGVKAGAVYDKSGSAKPIPVERGSHLVEVRLDSVDLKMLRVYLDKNGVAEITIKGSARH